MTDGRRSLIPAALAAAVAACVSVESLPDPRGALKPGQRVVVLVNQSPGPWIVDGGDSKAETAAKLSPLGFLVQGVQDEHVNSVSKDLQQYLPRPQYWFEAQKAIIGALKGAAGGRSVQTGLEAGVAPAQLYEWNKAKDQLDWRRRYYSPDPDQPPPRDYASALVLDDALILDANLSFGTAAIGEGDQNRAVPALSAAVRVYRGDTSRLLWEREEQVVDQTSTMTVVEFKLQPEDLTRRLEALAPVLGSAIAASFSKAFGLSAAPAVSTAPAQGGGLVPLSFLQNLSSAAPAGIVPPAAVAASTQAVVVSTSSVPN